jgi:2,3,4,5-tetrahydropyridine-2-carboxylate N-succinyltransferase
MLQLRSRGKAVLCANVYALTARLRLLMHTGDEPIEYKGFVPARSVVIQEVIRRNLQLRDFQVPCAMAEIENHRQTENIVE